VAKIKKIIDAMEGIKKVVFLFISIHLQKKFRFSDDITLCNTM
tara:strand:+ start:413 stop:541 length:129 start_codon:yes stop_codon:yes gene_type:complete